MKLFTKLIPLLIFILLLGVAFSYVLVTSAASFLTVTGGTGSTSPSGILYGDNNATNHLNTVTIGSNLTFSGGTLSATGGGGSGTVSTSTNETKGQMAYFTSTNGTPALLGVVATSSMGVTSPVTFSGTMGSQIGGVAGNFGCATCALTGTTLTVAGTANQITSSAGAQDLSANRTWTLSIPSLFLITQASTTMFSSLGSIFVGKTSTTTINGDLSTSTFSGNVLVKNTSGTAFNVQDAFGTAVLSVNTASSTGNIFTVQATSSATNFFGIDQYGHISATTTSPTLSSCGTAPSVTGGDQHGTVTTGATASGCTITFATTYTTAPTCVVSNQSMSVVNAMTYTVNATALTITETGLGGAKVDYICFANP